MGCVFSKHTVVEERVLHLPDGPQTRDCSEDAEILSLTEVGAQSFQGVKIEKKHHCSVCRQILDSDGACYRECKNAADINREPKSSKRQSDAPARSERGMENIMESRYDFDLTYITERIISVFFPPDLDEEQYRRNLKEVAAMLKSKHQEKFLIINLSEKRHDICRLNPKVEEFGWPDLHAPPLDKICTVCKTMEGWLNADPRNVVMLHCKGNRGKTGVIIAAYMHFSKISAGADHALTTVAMRKFCEDKISSALQPSQNRYIYYFSGLLSGAIKINSSSLLLHQVHIPAITNYKPGEVYAPFLKIYQSLKLVYTSGIHEINGSRNRMLCLKIEPALLLKGDIMVKCYHRRSGVCERECVFRVQFHTCTVHGSQLWFGKKELDHACDDKRYPADATVQLVFSTSSEQKKEKIQNVDPGGSPDISCKDPVVRWDSYENFNLHHEDSIEDICHTRGPLDGSLYAQVKKRRVPGSTSNNPLVINYSIPRQLPIRTSDSSHRSTCSELEGPPLSSSHYLHERDNKEIDGGNDKPNLKDKDRETAILDDADCSHPRVERSCCGRPYSHPHSYLGHDLFKTPPQKPQPKHFTLPCTRPSALPVCEPCGSPPNFLWERGHCQHHICTRSCYPFPSPETHTHSHGRSSHTLPVQARLFCSGDACPLLHYSPHAHSHPQNTQSQSSHQSLPSSPYYELRFSSTSPTSCSCTECLCLRENISHSLRVSHLESPPWHREPTFGYRQEGALHWKRDGDIDSQDPDCWQHKAVMSPIMSSFGYGQRHCHSITKHDHPVYGADSRPDPMSSPYPSPHSSGYHSPHLPWPCSPSHVRDSPGYASLTQSPNSSPLACTPSAKRTTLSQHHSHSHEAEKEHNIHYNHTEVSIEHSEAKNLQNLSSKEDGSNAVSMQVQDSEESPAEPEEFGNSTVANKDGPSSGSTLPELSKELQPSAAKNTDATEPTSTTILTSEPNQTSEPQVTALEAESLVSVIQVLESTSLSTDNEKNSTVPSERSSSCEFYLTGPSSKEQSMTSLIDCVSYNEDGSNSDLRSSSPVPDGYVTPLFPLASHNYPLLTVPHLPYTGYTAITIPSYPPQPPLPEKQQRVSTLQDSSSSASSVRLSTASLTSSVQASIPLIPSTDTRQKINSDQDNRVSAKFVQDTSKFWYKPGISRDQAIAVLKDKEPGFFLIRDSSSFQGAYGLALKVAKPPAHVSNHGHASHSQEQLVRHFLIESGAKGVKIKGCQNEMYFGSLSALVYQHSITPVSLPCKLHIPDNDLIGELQELQSDTNTSTAAELLKQGAACNVLYLNSVDIESLTGPQAISRAVKCTLSQKPGPSATIVHFKVSSQGITLTDNQRRLFFRRHYPIHNVIFSCVAPEDKRWTIAGNSSNRMFGFVARRSGSSSGNVCHLFAELDPEQPATAIINFINKVMLGPHHVRK